MRVVVTCGPSYEPIDAVRRITNFSTGELGILLANGLTRAGCEVVCFEGVAATCALPIEAARVLEFTTNDDLRTQLANLEERENVGAIFHAAALCDYRVQRVQLADGTEISAEKIPSRAGELTLKLVPVAKLLPELRGLFPKSKIVGWKYELDGSCDDVIAAAERQLREAQSDACVVNGAAYGTGFGFLPARQQMEGFASKAELCAFLVRWIGGEKQGV